MKDHQTYVIECRDSDCRASYEILAARALTVDDKDQVRRTRCPGCKGPVNIVTLGETGQWAANRAARAVGAGVAI